MRLWRNIEDDARALNRRINCGVAEVVFSTIFGFGKWRVQIDPLGGPIGRPVTIGVGYSPRAAIKDARDWLDRFGDDDGIVQERTVLDLMSGDPATKVRTNR